MIKRGKPNSLKEVAKEAGLTFSWLRTKNDEGKFQNFREALDEVSKSLKSPEIIKLVLTVTLTSSMAASLVAFDKELWSNFLDDKVNNYDLKVGHIENLEKDRTSTTSPKTDKKIEPPNFSEHAIWMFEDFTSRVKAAYENAPYEKYIMSGVTTANLLAILSFAGSRANQRRKEKQNPEQTLGL